MFCWQAWGGAFTPKSPFEVPKKLHLFMLKGPRKKHYQVVRYGSRSTKWTMQAISREALPLPATPKGVTKWAFIYVKRAKAKTVSYRTLGFPEYGMANASNFTRGFTPASNPERGNNIWATKWAFIYVKRAKAKNSVISYLRVPRVRNGQCKQFHARLYPCQQPRKG